MIQRTEELREAVRGSMLEGREIVRMPVLETGSFAFAIPIASSEVERAWRETRALLSKTGLWPVASTIWGDGGSSFAEKVFGEDYFGRFYFNEAPDCDDVAPASICRRAEGVDVARFLDEKEARLEEHHRVDEALESEPYEVEERCGELPDHSFMETARIDGEPIRTCYQLERWLHQFEHSRGFTHDPDEARQDWFENDPSVLLFLPTTSGWETLAYLNWFGTSDFGTEYYIALGKSWERRFGAELVAHYGTILQCLVSRPPRSTSEAFPLAREHSLAGPCTLLLPGIRLRDYADALVGWDRWFLHERP